MAGSMTFMGVAWISLENQGEVSIGIPSVILRILARR